MDFNYFYHRQQTECMRADAAASPEASAPHRTLAEAYGRLIAYERGRRAGAVAID